MAYADFTFYSTQYLGTAISESAFPQLALRASAVIDQITFGRAASDTENTTAIKNAMCAVAEAIQTLDTEGNASFISSETVGSHSVTYSSAAVQRTENETYAFAANLWLANTGLMFAGFFSGEYGSTLDAP